MKKTLAVLFSTFALAGCVTSSYKIDPVATANAPWTVGEIIRIDEDNDDQVILQNKWFFVGIAMDGAYLLREESYLEYSEEYWDLIEDTPESQNLLNGRIIHTLSEPYRVPDMTKWENEIIPATAIDGRFLSFYITGERFSECYFETNKGFCIRWYQSGGKKSESDYSYGDIIRSVIWYKNGQVRREWLTCGHYSCSNEKAWAEERIWNLDGKLVSYKTY